MSRRHRCPLFFFLILFFAFRIFFSCFFRQFFLVVPAQIRFQSNGSDIGLARPPIEPLTGTEKVDAFLRFLYSDLFFQSDREGISLVRPPIVVLTRTNAPLRHLYAQVYRFCVTISGVLFLCFLGIETFRGNLWRVKFLLFQPRTTLVFSTLFSLCGRTTLPTPF